MNTEYESVVSAALLHDIGKFYQRSQTDPSRHWELSAAFIEHHRAAFAEPDLVKTLVAHHHESLMLPDCAHPDAISNARHRILAYLVSRADSLSSRERSQAATSQAYQIRAPLVSLFTQVDIGKAASQAPTETLGYRLKRFTEGGGFPELLDAQYEHPPLEYERHMNQFLKEFAELFPKPFPGIADTLLYLLQKYLWCVPSDTTRELRDVSLADHMKVAGALAACFYQYHEATGWDEQEVKDDSAARVALACGDISGIQDYIYGIASVGEGGVAKRLRGRSFRISALTEAVALRILRLLDLPLACRIISAGGMFYILVPNTEEARSKLEQIRRRISDWLLGTYGGELAVSIALQELSGDQLAQGHFDAALDAVRDKAAQSKLRKFEEVLSEGSSPIPTEFHGRPACSVCEKRPAAGEMEEERACDECKLDVSIGQKLPSAKWLVYAEKPGRTAVKFFEDPALYASLVADAEEAAKLEPVMAYNLADSTLISSVPSGFAPYAGYVPRWRGLDEYNAACERYADLIEEEGHSEGAIRSGEAIKSFTALAATSEGTRLLGYLRADVDHLGMIFAIGMRERASISRIASISGMLNSFFTNELVSLIRQEFRDVYVAYSGGDDLMLVGPWSAIIELANRISEEFRRFTARNPNITISAGIGTYRPRVPIAFAAPETGEILEKSKAEGRGRLTVFGTTLEWNQFPRLKKWVELLSGEIQSGRISKAFLYRLWVYREQAEAFYKENNARSVQFKPHLAYDIGRNLTESDGTPKINTELYEMLLGLLGEEHAKEDWYLLQAAITWSAYLTRKEK